MIRYEVSVIREVKLYNRDNGMQKGIMLRKDGVELPFFPTFNMDIYDVNERLRTCISNVHYSLDCPGKIEAWGYVDYYVKKLFRDDIELSLDNEWKFFSDVDKAMWDEIKNG